MDKLDKVRGIGVGGLDLPSEIGARVQQMVREGLHFTAQAFLQMGAQPRTAIMTATLRDMEASLIDAALTLFEGLIGRAYNKAKKRVEEVLVEQADDAKQRLARVANVLDAILKAHERDESIEAAIAAVTTWEALSADTELLRRSSRTGMVDVLSELRREHYVFKAIGPRLLNAVTFQSRASAAPLLDALAIIKGLGVDTRKPLPDKVPETIVERSWRPHVFKDGGIDRQYYELAAYFALGTALRAGDVWVTGSKLHRSIEAYLSPSTSTTLVPARLPPSPTLTAAAYLDDRTALLDRRLFSTGDFWRWRRSWQPVNAPVRSSIAIGCRCRSRRPKMIQRHVCSPVGCMDCCRACKSPISLRKSTDGRASPICSATCRRDARIPNGAPSWPR